MVTRIRPVGSSTIGGPVRFVSGQFAGHAYRAELEEIQRAHHGRKFARKDRRPIDPPPVVRFKFIEILDGAGRSEREVETYDDFGGFGFICHVDLFLVPAGDESDTDMQSATPNCSSAYSPASSSSLVSSPRQHSDNFSAGLSYPIPPPHPSSSLSQREYTLAPPTQVPTQSTFPLSTVPKSLPPIHSLLASIPPPPSSPQILVLSSATSFEQAMYTSSATSATQSEVLAYAGNYAITESSKCTEALYGETFVQATVLDYQKKNQVMFVFPDLSVSMEGTFCLRYRVFNIFSEAWGEGQVPTLAECYGRPFKIYATKAFPGLGPSTDLTKKMSLNGVRVNVRPDDRKRQKTSGIAAGPSLQAATRGLSEAVSNWSASRVKGRNPRYGYVRSSSEGDDSDYDGEV